MEGFYEKISTKRCRLTLKTNSAGTSFDTGTIGRDSGSFAALLGAN